MKTKNIKKQHKGDEKSKDQENLKKDLLYLKAELDNFKRNSSKEKALLMKYSGESLIKDLLSCLDLFENALQMKIDEKNYQSFYDGMKMVQSELVKTLSEHGLSIKPVEKNDEFDPHIHEAISYESSEFKKGKIIQIFKKAFQFHDKLIRPAQVSVSQGKKEGS